MKRIVMSSVLAATALLAFMFVVQGERARPAEAALCPMDVVFVIDDTGSMGGAIASVAAEIGTLFGVGGTIDTASKGDYRVGLVTFKDNVTVVNDWTAAPAAAVATNVALLAAGGGAGAPEASDEALNTVINGLAAPGPGGTQVGNFGLFRPGGNITKIIVLVTDAPPGGFDDVYAAVDDANVALRIAEAAGFAGGGIKISAIFVPTGGDYAGQAAIMMSYSSGTGGLYTETLPTGEGTGAAIIEKIIACGGGEPPSVGGVAELPAGSDAPAARTDGAGGLPSSAALFGGAAIALALAVAVGGWFARRRWML